MMINYLDWHYKKVWPTLFLIWRNLTLFPFYYFSIPLHLQTFFCPWKRQTYKTGAGFDFGEFLSVTSINLISRLLGATLRMMVIAYGFILMLLAFVFFSFIPLLWPFFVGASLPFYFFKAPEKDREASYLLKKAGKNLQKLAILLFMHPSGRFVAWHLGFVPQALIKIFGSAEEEKDGFENFLKQLKKKAGEPGLSDLFECLSLFYFPFKELLEKNNLKSQDVYQTCRWYEQLQNNLLPLLLDLPRIKKLAGIGADWTYGYTVEFDKYASDLTKEHPLFPLLLGREKEIKQLEQILIKTETNNALLVGEPGVARHLLVETVAHRILSGCCLPGLARKRILSVNMQALLASKPTIQEVKGLMSDIFAEAQRAGNIIIEIDELDKYTSSSEGKVDLSDVLLKFAKSSIGFIGITTPYAFHKFIETNPTIAPVFEKIEIAPPDEKTVLTELLVSIVPVLEKKYQLIITYPAVIKAIEDASRYISTTPFPAKAISLLDEACVFLLDKKEAVLMADHVDQFLSEKTNIPIGNLQNQEKEKLVRLEELLHQQVINQDAAISAISAALRRARLNVSSISRPIGAFLFLGPTGVGKTETAKALTKVYFGHEDRLLRFDMSQYQKEEGIERLIGSAKLGSVGELTSKLRDFPFSLLLFDEFEKSDKEIFNLFLTLIDEGYIVDAMGKKVDGRNSIIIATSNAGAEYIRENINQKISPEELQRNLIDYVQREKIFSPELLNRFDDVIVFTPLSEGHLREVARLMLNRLNKRLESKEIAVAVTPLLIKKLASIGFDPQFGGRAMRRLISEKIEDEVAKRILAGKVKKGEEIQIDL